MPWTSLCDLDELKEGEGKYVEIDGFHLAVFLHEGQPRVLDDVCPHAGGSLARGWVEQGCVVCPLHLWPFRLDNGQLRDTPGVTVTTYRVRLLPREGRPTLVQADLPLP
jgi:nitrite reductase/ring-hydroxylating ferredoxin subunit